MDDKRAASVIWKHTHRATGQVTLSTEDMPDLPFNRKTWESTPHYAAQASAPATSEEVEQNAARYLHLRDWGVPELCVCISGVPSYIGDTPKDRAGPRLDAIVDASISAFKKDEE